MSVFEKFMAPYKLKFNIARIFMLTVFVLVLGIAAVIGSVANGWAGVFSLAVGLIIAWFATKGMRNWMWNYLAFRKWANRRMFTLTWVLASGRTDEESVKRELDVAAKFHNV